MTINSSFLSYKYCKFYFGNKLLTNFDCSDGCDSVMMSSYSLIFGLPVPLYGLVYFLGLTLIFILHQKKILEQKYSFRLSRSRPGIRGLLPLCFVLCTSTKLQVLFAKS
jgi:uncharacterized membrane protein